jgi:hypothetical protein
MAGVGALEGLPGEHIESLVAVLNAVRNAGSTTRPEIARQTGLGRNVVTDRTNQLIAAGLLAEGPLARSTGGRSPRQLRFRAEVGVILVAELGATSIEVALSDLAGNITHPRGEAADVTRGPEHVLKRVAEMFDDLVAGLPQDAQVWGVGLGRRSSGPGSMRRCGWTTTST